MAVELRNRNWVEVQQLHETTAFFRDQGATLVSVQRHASMDVVTNQRISYLRLHGRNERAYIIGKTVAHWFDYDYSDDEL